MLGTVLANAMFDLAVIQVSDKARASTGMWIGEIAATAGLIALIFALARTGRRPALSAGAVGTYIGAAYWYKACTRGPLMPRLLGLPLLVAKPAAGTWSSTAVHRVRSRPPAS